MTALLTDNLPLLSGAPNGIQKLRELILELAVRGKLVPHDPADEPASELLKRIAEEKARLVAEGKIKKQKPLAEIGEEEKPFELPKGWEWVRVAAVGHDWGQKTPDQEFTYIDVGSVDNSIGEIGTPQVVVAEEAPSRARKIVRIGTIIYSTIRPYLLNVAVIEREYSSEPIASTAFAIIHPYLDMPSRYFLWYLRSPVFVRYVESVQTGIAYPAINDGQFYSGLIPLPPLAEQHRIVAKVDELMALCDRLEARQTDAESAHARLVQALLDSLTQASDATDFAASWQRLAEHFHSLFTSEASIDALKQTLLQLAVMGKLVPQVPSDEPASELLKRIAEEKARLMAEGKLSKQKASLDLAREEMPYELPGGWCWSTLPAIGELARGKSRHRPRNDPALYVGGDIPLVQTGDVARANGVINTYTALYNEVGLEQSRLWPEGTMCITIAANIADSAILGFDACFPDSVVGFVPYLEEMDVRYFEFFLRTAKSHLEDFAPSTAQKNINLEILSCLSVPLPPVAEANRIVAKVNQLMALCDQLKTRLGDARHLHERLAGTLVESAIA